MQNKIAWVDRILPKEILSKSWVERQRARMFVLFCFSISFVLYALGFTYVAMAIPELYTICLSAAILFSLSAFLPCITKSTSLSFHISAVAGLYSIFGTALYLGGITSPSMVWAVALPFCCSMLMDRKWGYFYGAISAGLSIILYGAAVLGYKYSNLLTPEQSQHIFMICVVCLLVFSTLLVDAYQNYRDRAQRELEIINLKLAEKDALLERKLKENTNLIRVLSHDLNNPLTVITAAAEMEEMQSEELLPYTKRISRAANTIRDIISHVRQYMALDSGKKQIDLQPVCIDTCIDNSLFIFQQRLNDKKIRIVYDRGLKSEKVYVTAEAVSFNNDVINNIISNAIKFSFIGSEIRVATSEIGKDWIRVSISDSGVGIPEDIIQDIFSLDKKTTRDGTDGEKGTGYGMPLVKSYMEHYGGKVMVESRTIEMSSHSHGTTIHLFLRPWTQVVVKKSA